MRAFVAINLPAELKKKVAEFQAELKKQGLVVGNWTSDYHLTLKFLGEIGDEKRKKIDPLLAEIAGRTKKFDFELKGLGAFPSENYARVLWIGTRAGNEEANILQKEIDEALSKTGFEKEKNYANHLTIARAKAVTDKRKLKNAFEKYKSKSFGIFTVGKISLIESILTKTGAIYKILAEFSLQPNP